ncbi:recombinase family protein [Aestuariicoccus sp. MJ-SS9]|uniref:recombinase family protein n=1 Tax=Aestuariicoccus sp. MJ-SS9 TaxID=3079855 RepID=UPI00290A9C65|nr:recombinase family protein [Aestuariicoccus sp. MJ-SS9]MDU8912867.1 recombinase family protein [Aestuariicoccus sp. MJ-SS9]
MIRQRCAIYTRKSTEEGLDQSFNTLDAQREACAAYILSQRHEGWLELSDAYDDGGFSGGSMERPGLQRLVADIRAGRIDVVVVYKVDRLTRALADFAKLVEIFDGAGVSFVSVTQAFNTTTSMGRLTLNVLLSFAQFEREVTAERIRDKVAAPKKKGMWMGGAVPMGYDAKDKALVIKDTEAEAVRTIFREYLTLGSVPALRKRLSTLGIVSKCRTDRHGRETGGCAFSTGALYHLLRNPVYAGKVRHGDVLHEGQHSPIVDWASWQQVQDLLDRNGGGPISGRRKAAARWLDGRLFDPKGRPMRTTYATRAVRAGSVRQSKRYWYYVSKADAADERAKDRLPAAPLETIVHDAILDQLSDRAWIANSLSAANVGSEVLGPALARAQSIAAQGSKRARDDGETSIEAFAQRIDVSEGKLQITLDLAPLLEDEPERAILAPPVTIPMSLRRQGRNRSIVLHAETGAPRRDADLIALVADARRWMADLLEGRASSVAEITQREKVRPGTVSRILPLAWLAPDIAKAILEGRQPSDLPARHLREISHLPLDWEDQRRILGFPGV